MISNYNTRMRLKMETRPICRVFWHKKEMLEKCGEEVVKTQGEERDRSNKIRVTLLSLYLGF